MARKQVSRIPAIDPDDVKKVILNAALEIFGTVGFDGASIGSIAKQCGVSTALVHYYFSSKGELWSNAVAKGMADYVHELKLSSDDTADLNPITRLRFSIRRYINYFAKNPFIFSIIVKESEVGSPRFKWLQKHHLKTFYGPWTDTIKAVRDAGLLRISAPDYHIVLIIVGACLHFLTSRHRVLPIYGVGPVHPELIRQHADLVVDVIVHGITRIGEEGMTRSGI